MNSNQTCCQTTMPATQSPCHREQRLLAGTINPAWGLITGLLLAMILFVPNPVNAKPNTDDTATIEYLIGYVSQSDMIFVRNFGEHAPQKAAKHIRDKYEHFYDDIDSPETFIELCATKSLITGRDYTVIDPDGSKIKTSVWLLSALKTYREQSNQ